MCDNKERKMVNFKLEKEQVEGRWNIQFPKVVAPPSIHTVPEVCCHGKEI